MKPCSKRAPNPNFVALCVVCEPAAAAADDDDSDTGCGDVPSKTDECVDVVGDCGLS